MKIVPCVSNIWLFFFWARHKHLKVSCDEGILTLNILLFLERTMFHSCNWRVLSHSPVFKYLLWSLILTTNYSINDSGLLLTRFYILNQLLSVNLSIATWPRFYLTPCFSIGGWCLSDSISLHPVSLFGFLTWLYLLVYWSNTFLY